MIINHDEKRSDPSLGRLVILAETQQANSGQESLLRIYWLIFPWRAACRHIGCNLILEKILRRISKIMSSGKVPCFDLMDV